MECLPSCFVTTYETKLKKWQDWRPGRSLQIVLSDFAVAYKEEYLGCGSTCIIGEIGGNLGFFLGGSLLLAIKIGMNYIGNGIELMCEFFGRKY